MKIGSEEKKEQFLELITQVKNNCLQEIDNEYAKADKIIDSYLKEIKNQHTPHE